jgi:hypothetical protein
MYEMEGPRSAAQPSTPIAQLPVNPAAVRCQPGHQAHPPKHGTPVSRRSVRSGVSPE